jgi:hypothetical protein
MDDVLRINNLLSERTEGERKWEDDMKNWQKIIFS